MTTALEGGEVSVTLRPLFTPRKDPVPIVQEAGWAPGPVWTGGKSRPTGIRPPERPARSQSLYQLSYPAHTARRRLSIVRKEAAKESDGRCDNVLTESKFMFINTL